MPVDKSRYPACWPSRLAHTHILLAVYKNMLAKLIEGTKSCLVTKREELLEWWQFTKSLLTIAYRIALTESKRYRASKSQEPISSQTF